MICCEIYNKVNEKILRQIKKDLFYVYYVVQVKNNAKLKNENRFLVIQNKRSLFLKCIPLIRF